MTTLDYTSPGTRPGRQRPRWLLPNLPIAVLTAIAGLFCLLVVALDFISIGPDADLSGRTADASRLLPVYGALTTVALLAIYLRRTAIVAGLLVAAVTAATPLHSALFSPIFRWFAEFAAVFVTVAAWLADRRNPLEKRRGAGRLRQSALVAIGFVAVDWQTRIFLGAMPWQVPAFVAPVPARFSVDAMSSQFGSDLRATVVNHTLTVRFGAAAVNVPVPLPQMQYEGASTGFSGDGRFVAVVDDDSVAVFSVQTSPTLKVSPIITSTPRPRVIRPDGWVPDNHIDDFVLVDGRTMLLGFRDQLQLVRLTPGINTPAAVAWSIPDLNMAMENLAAAADGSRFTATLLAGDSHVQTYDLRTGTEIRTVRASVRTLAMTDDGQAEIATDYDRWGVLIFPVHRSPVPLLVTAGLLGLWIVRLHKTTRRDSRTYSAEQLQPGSPVQTG